MATDLQHGTEPSMTDLVKGIIDDVQVLTRQQFDLLKHELQEDLSKTRQAAMPMLAGLGVLLIGALLLGATLGLLLEWAFRPHLPLWGAFGIVTAVFAAAGLGLFFAGQKKFQTFNPLPDRTLDALKENVQCLTNPK
jgi:uncharacterized membrane protein YqjE